MSNRKQGILAISTDGATSQVQVSGTRADILFNWIALTQQVCRTLEVSPECLAMKMPGYIQNYLRHELNYDVTIPVPRGKRQSEE